MTPRYKITEATGRVVIGRVRGYGGSYLRLARLLFAIRQATAGKETKLCEPKPGHAIVCEYSSDPADETEIEHCVDLRGARTEALPPETWPCKKCKTQTIPIVSSQGPSKVDIWCPVCHDIQHTDDRWLWTQAGADKPLRKINP